MTPVRRPGGNTYSEAVAATTRLISETGKVPSLRDVAAKIAVPETELIQLFPDARHLMIATAESAMMLLQDKCIRTVVEADADDPLAQFEALAYAYVEWAYSHPREFRLIGSMPAGQFEGNDRLMRYEQSIHELMYKLLQRAQGKNMLPAGENLTALIAVSHTYAYGVASKMLLGDLARWMPGLSERDAARSALHLFIRKVLH